MMATSFHIDVTLAQTLTVYAMAMVAVGLCLSTYRLIRGPDVIDRIIALDVIGTLAIGVVVLEAVRSSRALFLDIALCMAILLFLGTVAFALYYQKGDNV